MQFSEMTQHSAYSLIMQYCNKSIKISQIPTNTYLANCSSAILRAFDNGTLSSICTDIIASKYLGIADTFELTVTGEMSTITNFSTNSG